MEEFVDKAYGCLAAGLIGDSMGSPTENLEPDEISKRFGWVSDFEGDGTDDSMLKYLLCDALLRTDGYATVDDWAQDWRAHRGAITRHGRFFISVLHTVRKLEYCSPRSACVGNLPSSSSAMCIAPVGIVNAGHPRAAAMQAQDLAGLIHTGEVSFCQDGAVAIAAAVAEAFSPHASVTSVLEASTAFLKPESGRLMADLIRNALELAEEAGEYEAFRSAYHGSFRQAIACDSRETVPAALALVKLAGGDIVKAVTYGANFGRDTDTIATMAGAICGALRGASGIPKEWLEKVDRHASRNQRELAAELVAVGKKKAENELRAWGLLAKAGA